MDYLPGTRILLLAYLQTLPTNGLKYNVGGNTTTTPTEVKITLFWLTGTNVSEERAASIFAVKHVILVPSMNLLSVSRVQA